MFRPGPRGEGRGPEGRGGGGPPGPPPDGLPGGEGPGREKGSPADEPSGEREKQIAEAIALRKSAVDRIVASLSLEQLAAW
jgi:hypothetical protein